MHFSEVEFVLSHFSKTCCISHNVIQRLALKIEDSGNYLLHFVDFCTQGSRFHL